jgi:hypothetical protein
MLVKRHGKRLVYSIVFYDKRERVAQMRQGKTLTLEEVDAVNSHVRLDITAHSEGIEAIVAAARRRLKNLIKRDPGLFPSPWRDDFLNNDVRPTDWWLRCAIFVLSHFTHDQELTRGSFAKWLIPHILRRILRMDVIAGFTSEGFHCLDALNDKVAAAWRAAAHSETENWAEVLAKAAKCSRATVYTRRERWLTNFGVDIALGMDSIAIFSFTAPTVSPSRKIAPRFCARCAPARAPRQSDCSTMRRVISTVSGRRSSARPSTPARAPCRSRSPARSCRRRVRHAQYRASARGD